MSDGKNKEKKRPPRKPYRKPGIESARAYTRNAIACLKPSVADCGPDADPDAFAS